MSHSAPTVAVLQTVIPHYRLPLFEAVARATPGAFRVHAAAEAPGHPVSVVSTGGIYHIDQTMRPLAGGRLVWQEGAFGVLRSLRRGDRLVVTGDPRIASNLPLMALARARGVRTTWWGQGFTAGTAGRVRMRQQMMRRADSVLLYTDREVQRYQAMGFEHTDIRGLNNALDQMPIRTARGRWSNRRLAAFQAAKGLDPARTLLTVGRVTDKMRVDLAIRALVDADLRDAHLVVVGDGPCRAAGEALARDLGVADRVRWEGAIYDEARLSPYFLSARAFLYPGSIGLSILHAFGYGLPVVTHSDEANQMPEFAALVDHVNGATFAPGSVDGVVRAVDEASRNASLFGHNAEDTVRDGWTLQAAASRFQGSLAYAM